MDFKDEDPQPPSTMQHVVNEQENVNPVVESTQANYDLWECVYCELPFLSEQLCHDHEQMCVAAPKPSLTIPEMQATENKEIGEERQQTSPPAPSEKDASLLAKDSLNDKLDKRGDMVHVEPNDNSGNVAGKAIRNPVEQSTPRSDSSDESSSLSDDDEVIDISNVRSLRPPPALGVQPVDGLTTGPASMMQELPFDLDKNDPLFQPEKEDEAITNHDKTDTHQSQKGDEGAERVAEIDAQVTMSAHESKGPLGYQSLATTADLNPAASPLVMHTAIADNNMSDDTGSAIQHPEFPLNTAIATPAATATTNPVEAVVGSQTTSSDAASTTRVEPQDELDEQALQQSGSSTEAIEKTTSENGEASIETSNQQLSWEDYYKELQEYKRENRHCRVPSKDKTKFANWVRNQRTILGKKRHEVEISERDTYRIRLLDELDFEWPRDKPVGDNASTSVCPTEEHARPPQDEEMDSSDKHNVAEAQGHRTWDESYALLVDYVKKTGSTKVRSNDKSKLANWVRNQRAILGKKRRERDLRSVDSQRVARLEEIGFEWSQIRSRQGSPVSSGTNSGSSLNDGSIPNEIGQDFDTTDKSTGDDKVRRTWDEYYLELQAFHEKHGHTRVNSKCKFGVWVRNQRHGVLSKARSGGDASPTKLKRIALLDRLGFEWPRSRSSSPVSSIAFHSPRVSGISNPDEDAQMTNDESTWDEMYARLEAFQKEHRHTNVHDDNSPLSTWVCTQRLILGENRRDREVRPLDAQRIGKLDSIGFDWAQVPAETSCSPSTSETNKSDESRPLLPGGVSEEERDEQRAENQAESTKPPEWDDMYQELAHFFRENNHIVVSAKENPQLHRWLCSQISILGSRRVLDSISDKGSDKDCSRIRALDALGITWPSSSTERASKVSRATDEEREDGHTVGNPKEFGGLPEQAMHDSVDDSLDKNRIETGVLSQNGGCTHALPENDIHTDHPQKQSLSTEPANDAVFSRESGLLDDTARDRTAEQNVRDYDRAEADHHERSSELRAFVGLERENSFALNDSAAPPSRCDEAGMSEQEQQNQTSVRREDAEYQQEIDASSNKRGLWKPSRARRLRCLSADQIFEVDNELMAELDDEIKMSEESTLMRILDEEIWKTEERNLMEELDKDLIADVKKHVGNVLEVEYMEGDQRKHKIYWHGTHHVKTRKDHSPAEGRGKAHYVSDVLEVASLSKLVPKSIAGRQFVTTEDKARLREKLSKDGLSHGIKFEAFGGDPGSLLVTIWSKLDAIKKCHVVFQEWLRQSLYQFQVGILKQLGSRLVVTVDPTISLGLRLIGYEDFVVFTASPEKGPDACSIDQLKPAIRRGLILLDEVDGKACTSTEDFKERRKLCESEGRSLELSFTVMSSETEVDFGSAAHESVGQIVVHQNELGTGSRDLLPQEMGSIASPDDRVSVMDEDVTMSFGGEDSDHDEAANCDEAAGLQPSNNRDAFTNFKSKYSKVAELEYKAEARIKIQSAVALMWKTHKQEFGSACDDFCPCVFRIDHLSRYVIRDMLKKKKKWENPLGLKKNDIPIGFAGRFCPKFSGLMKEEYPNESSSQILKKLISMWSEHVRNRSFGMKCGPKCDCLEGWETCFNKGLPHMREVGASRKPKNQLRHSNSQSGRSVYTKEISNRGTPRPKRTWQSEADQRERKKLRAEYDVKFSTSEPMGYFFSNQDGACKVKSIFKSRDERIRIETTVVAVVDERRKISITRFEELRAVYEEFKKERKREFWVRFINLQSDDKADEGGRNERWKNLQVENEMWSRNGKWKGSVERGWPGGAFLLRNKAPRRQPPSSNSATDNPREMSLPTPTTVEPPKASQPIVQKGSLDVNSSREEECTEYKDEWEEMNDLRDLVHFEPKPIMKYMTDTDTHAKKGTVRFLNQDEIRYYESTNASNSFWRICLFQPSMLYDVLEKGSFRGLLTLVDKKRALFHIPELNFLQKMRRSISGKRETDRDFMVKDRILKIFCHAAELAQQAECLRFLKHFKVLVETIEMKFLPERGILPGKDLLVKLHYSKHSNSHDHHADRREIGLSFTSRECFTFPPSSQSDPFKMRCNIADPDQAFEVEILEHDKSTGKYVVLGRNRLVAKDFSNICREGNEGKFGLSIYSSSSKLGQCKVNLFIQCCSEEEREEQRAKRKSLSRGLQSILEWIDTFNKTELKPEELETHRLSDHVPVFGRTLLESAILIADEIFVEKLIERDLVPTPENVYFAELQAKSVDRYAEVRTRIVSILKSCFSSRAQVVEQQRPHSLEENTLEESQFLHTKDWLFRLERSARYKKRCRNFEQGHCQYGKTCFFGHVVKPGQKSLSGARKGYDRQLVETKLIRDSMGTTWYTTGYFDGNEFFYANGQQGLLCEPTGIHWYKSLEQAKRAIKATVDDYML